VPDPIDSLILPIDAALLSDLLLLLWLLLLRWQLDWLLLLLLALPLLL
jgi:hypothetical protein